MIHSENAKIVFEKRYLRKNQEGETIETPEDLFKRVAKAVAGAERLFSKTDSLSNWEERFYHLLSSFDFLPNSPTLMNAGLSKGQLSACFVLPVEDSLKSIFTTLKNAALVQQSGGGTGFNFSHLRPKGDPITRTGGEASGPVSFVKVFDAATQHIKQGGRRRGANMGVLNIDHPDILEFIRAKRGEQILSNFNLSVGITDTFMEAVEKNEIWALKHPSTNRIVSRVRAHKLWEEMVQSAWETGDPGLLFLDEINRKNPTPQIGKIEATNPCGEVPLLPYEACTLGSINLTNMLKKKGDGFAVDWEKMDHTVKVAIRFLDNTIEINHYEIPQMKKAALGNRKIGLGVMGWAEMLIELGIPYDSDVALALGEKLMEFISMKSFETSKDLAKKRGTFPNWEKSIYYPQNPIRNATRTSIAPTGTISILADCSSSIEPLFALKFERKHILDGEGLKETNRVFLDQAKRSKGVSEDLINQWTTNNEGLLMQHLPLNIKELFPTALTIKWQYHVKHQVAFQKFTDNGVSKTINLPESATSEDVNNAFKMAWKLQSKGITIYRDQSKTRQVLNVEGQKKIPAKLHGGTASCKVCSI